MDLSSRLHIWGGEVPGVQPVHTPLFSTGPQWCREGQVQTATPLLAS